MPAKTHVKVLRLQILKPADDTKWKDLAKSLRDVRYRVFRLANLVVSEAYLNFHLWRSERTSEFKTRTVGQLNRELRRMLAKEDSAQASLNATISKTGAVPDTICGALSHYKIRGLTSASKWRDVLRGKASLPTFRVNMSIPIRCDKPTQRRLERTANGDVELDLMISVKPYPRVILQTGKLHGGPRAILDRLLDATDGYRQRCFEVKHEESTNRWWLYVTYDFPVSQEQTLSAEKIVGVDLGFSCPLYAAINHGHARLGWRHFAGLAARIRSLQTQVMARRRNMLTGGKSSLSADTARSGHGRNRKLQSIQRLEGRINHAYSTLNHQLSSTLIDFAKNNGAGVIQIEDLSGLQDVLTGTFLGARWRYHQLQEYLAYKAKEAGIEVRQVNPRFTSRRCSECGYIVADFDRKFRDANKPAGYTTRFKCPQCEYEVDPDYNAARNLATLDIEDAIKRQCKAQGLDYPASKDRSLTIGTT